MSSYRVVEDKPKDWVASLVFAIIIALISYYFGTGAYIGKLEELNTSVEQLTELREKCLGHKEYNQVCEATYLPVAPIEQDNSDHCWGTGGDTSSDAPPKNNPCIKNKIKAPE